MKRLAIFKFLHSINRHKPKKVQLFANLALQNGDIILKNENFCNQHKSGSTSRYPLGKNGNKKGLTETHQFLKIVNFQKPLFVEFKEQKSSFCSQKSHLAQILQEHIWRVFINKNKDKNGPRT